MTSLLKVISAPTTTYRFAAARRYSIESGAGRNKRSRVVATAIQCHMLNGMGERPLLNSNSVWYVSMDPGVPTEDRLYASLESTYGPFANEDDAFSYVQLQIDLRIKGMVFDSLCAEMDRGTSER